MGWDSEGGNRLGKWIELVTRDDRKRALVDYD